MAQWMVRCEGSDPIGPVSTELLLRGIAQGRVPVESEVQQLGTREWQILEFVDAFADAIQSDEAMTRLAESPLDDADILAYADAEEAFTRLVMPGAVSSGRQPPPPPPNPARRSSARFPADATRSGAAGATYDEDDDVATRVVSSPLSDGGPPSIPAAALSRPSPPEQTLDTGPPAFVVQNTPQTASQQPVSQPTRHAPRASGAGLATGLLALLVLVLAGCLGVLLWLLSRK
ncbi:MAG: hypothetical protein KC766_16335 [Myxococcales bacterium]|nr:hypothetical protein [Myxococcales bacterium]